ncbi:MAG: DUF58 domain-containing protein [Chloroflexaceae bacterium]|nr:DUF58 domain-containing protein [Chloroflexaceae bacterium]
MAGDIQGERRSPRRGTSVEFADFRPYTAGDDFRQIDWNLYARLDRVFLKLFVAEEELTFHLLLDTSASMDWGEPHKLTYAQRLLGAAGYIALNNLDRVTVMVAGGTSQGLPGVRGKRGVFPLFRFLEGIEAGGGNDLVRTCQRYVQTARNPGPLLFCSDLLDASWQEALRALSSRRFEITLMHVLAPQELDPQLEGDFRLIDPEGGPTVEITADFDLLERYRQNLANWRSEIEQFCHRRGIRYLFVDTTIPVEELILSRMRQRGMVR